jgi:apolipoprotein N-acyltransferase
MSTGRRAVRDLFLLVLGAVLYTVASPPYEWSGAAWLALAPLYLVLHDKTPRTGFAAGFLYGLLFSAGITPWAYFAVAAYFSFSLPFDVFFTFLIYALFVGPYTGLAASGSCVLMRSHRPLLRWAGIPALWVSAEFARSSFFSGFAWELLGHTQYHYLALIQVTDLTGVYGLSFLMALSGYVVAEFLVSCRLCQSTIHNSQSATTRFPWPALGCLLAGAALVLLYGMVRLRQYHHPVPSAPVTVAMVQANAPSAQRWQRVHYASTLLRYLSVTRQGIGGVQPDLIVWPEFAVGFYLDQEPLLRTQLAGLTQGVDAPLLLGGPRMKASAAGNRYYNSAYLLAPDGKLLNTYDKMRLLPFAEYRPLALPALIHHSFEPPSEFTAGKRATVFSLPEGTFGVTICYEITYPDLARRLAQRGAQFLINIANDTWLVAGGSAAAVQHFSLAVFRAVENRRPLVRVATAGISGFIDPTGRSSALPPEEGVAFGEVFPRQERTIYTQYGDWFACSCVGAALVALLGTVRGNGGADLLRP